MIGLGIDAAACVTGWTPGSIRRGVSSLAEPGGDLVWAVIFDRPEAGLGVVTGLALSPAVET
jgi:hypothetical protein